ncbi:hypothetical protein SAMN04487898_115159 [Pedobacter sp. ok626]|uniref:DUF6520 family protein n=1 Tax=Pedobacter sp. ok626 TaxID=1761882 RepID=UPI0008856F35|nr:DUF6520 family protein [Pedobacter sp. ok626]SDL16285.1 hypothetical protein SAMN04487898_115159 [Pedobacter sp. ok626]
MKKIFFTALVAVVAIGGAFAGQSTSVVIDAGPLNVTDDDNCSQSKPCYYPFGPSCVIGGVQYYQHDTEEGNCVKFLSLAPE